MSSDNKIYSEDASRASMAAFFAEKNKNDPEPIVRYFRDDPDFQRNADSSDRHKLCPDHGMPMNAKAPDSLPVGQSTSCQYCTLEMQYSNNRELLREIALQGASHKKMGNRIPKSGQIWKDGKWKDVSGYEALKNHYSWEDRQAAYAKEFNEKVRLSEQEVHFAKTLASMQRAGMINVVDE